MYYSIIIQSGLDRDYMDLNTGRSAPFVSQTVSRIKTKLHKNYRELNPLKHW